MLCPTPTERLCDDRGRPYFLWDCDVTLLQLQGFLNASAADQRVYWIAKVMRQAKPDDAISIVGRPAMRELWTRVAPTLGRARDFWDWYLKWAP